MGCGPLLAALLLTWCPWAPSEGEHYRALAPPCNSSAVDEAHRRISSGECAKLPVALAKTYVGCYPIAVLPHGHDIVSSCIESEGFWEVKHPGELAMMAGVNLKADRDGNKRAVGGDASAQQRRHKSMGMRLPRPLLPPAARRRRSPHARAHARAHAHT